MSPLEPVATAQDIATAVSDGAVAASDVVSAALERVAAAQPRCNAFRLISEARARRAAVDLDRRIARGERVGPLAGVPFAVKDLFDLEGVRTAAGSRVLLDRPPASRDADAVRRLVAADAIPLGTSVMDEFAFGFTTENSHAGPVRNPHDTTRTAGGSSGGSAAAVAAGLVPFTLGSDTNGSVRVPASLCGVFGLKPTYGAVDRAGVQLFSDSLDHVGAFARSPVDLDMAARLLIDDMTGSTLADSPRVGLLGGWFADNADEQALGAARAAASGLGEVVEIELPSAEGAHAAASVITYAEAGELHIDRIRHERQRFDAVVRHRLVAGALLPADWYVRAQRFRAAWAGEVADALGSVDLLVAPATPFAAPELGTETVLVNGRSLPARPAVGWLTQPLTPTGVPIGVAPVWHEGRPLPIGVQVIASARREANILDALVRLEASGVARSPVAEEFA